MGAYKLFRLDLMVDLEMVGAENGAGSLMGPPWPPVYPMAFDLCNIRMRIV